MDLYRKIVEIREQGRRAALATIVRRRGSAPRKDSAKMLILDDGTTYGSVGGGCVEGEVWQKARTVLETGKSEFVSFTLNETDAANEGLICGGTVDIFIEAIMSDPRLFILGAGHLGRAVTPLAKSVGFAVTVIDDRESFASRKRIPDADAVAVRPFENALDGFTIRRNDFVLVVTRGHSHDLVATEQAIRTDARYVGLVGSRRKIKLIVDTLLEKGIPAERFQRLYAPIGLDIGSETPEEIAIAVVAELVAVRKGKHKRSPKQEFILAQQADSTH